MEIPYKVKTFRDAGLEAKWSKTSTGRPIIIARRPGTKQFYFISASVYFDMKRFGIAEAWESWTVLADVFSL